MRSILGFSVFPRLQDASVVRKALAAGIGEGLFGYTRRGEPPVVGQVSERGSVYQVRRDQVVIGRPLAENEVDLDGGFILLPQALPPVPVSVPGPVAPGPGPVPPGRHHPVSAKPRQAPARLRHRPAPRRRRPLSA